MKKFKLFIPTLLFVLGMGVFTDEYWYGFASGYGGIDYPYN